MKPSLDIRLSAPVINNYNDIFNINNYPLHTIYKKFAIGLIAISLVSNLSALDNSNITNPPKPLPLTPDTANKAFAPQVLKAHNNVPIVNITTPNAVGISNNAFKDFNVNKNGLIFNNIKDSPSLTRLSGYINSNPNLNHSSTAKLILNQVTSSHSSTLLGYMEVAGGRANLIIANPNGISCIGCGFINTANATMITGKLSKEFNDQFLMMKNMQDAVKTLKFQVKDGTINIGDFNGKNLQAINLISRSLTINGKIDASKIAMILGQNNITLDPTNASILLFQPISVPADKLAKTKKPLLALDVAYMGGVYANSIYLIASEDGVGVKNSGTIATFPSRDGHDGGFIIRSNGDIEITKPEMMKAPTPEPRSNKANQESTQQTIPVSSISSSSDTLDTINLNPNAPIHLTSSTPMFYAGGNMSIIAPNIKNHSIIYGEKNISIGTTGNIDNIGEMSLESKVLSKEHHYHRDGSPKYHSDYDYTTTISQDELKVGSYHPAIIYAKGSLNLSAKTINNTSSIIATPKGKLTNQANLNNTNPTPKRTEENVGTRTDYNRHGDCTPILSLMNKNEFCHSLTTHHPYHPAPKISTLSIEDLHIPTIPLEEMMGEYVDTIIDRYNATTHPYIIDTDPLYQNPTAFLQTSSFQESVLDSPVLSTMMDTTDIENHLNALQANPFSLGNAGSVGIGITAKTAYLSSTNSLYNTSAINAGSLYISSDNITNANGFVHSSKDMNIFAKSFDSDSGSLQAAGDIRVDAKDISLKTTTTSNFNALHKRDIFGYRYLDSSSSNETINTASTMKAKNIFINALNSISIQGADLQSDNDMNLKAKNINITTATAKEHYEDHTKTDINSTHKSSVLHSGHNLTLDTTGGLNFSSVNASAGDNITFTTLKDITLDTATNNTYHRLTTTDYSSGKKGDVKKSSFALTSTTTTTTTEDSTRANIANILNAKSINIHSGGNTTAYNLSSKADDFIIDSKGNVKLSNHADIAHQDIHTKIDTTGLYGSAANGKLSLSAGTDHTTSDAHSNWSVHNNQSINADDISIISTAGNVALQSSDLSTSPNGTITLSGDDVSVSSLANAASSDTHSTTKSNRIGISITAPTDVINANWTSALGNLGLDGVKSSLAWGKGIKGLKTISKFADKIIPGKTLGALRSEIVDDTLHPGVSIGITHTTITSDTHKNDTFASSSNFTSGNLLITSKNDTHIIGSTLSAKNASVDAKNLNISSAQNTSNQTSKTNTQTTSLTFSAKIKGRDTGISGNLAYQNTDENTHKDSITHTASKLDIGSLNVNAAADTNITGSILNTDTANIQTKKINLQASKDSTDKSSETLSYGGSIEVGYDGGLNAGLSANISQSSDTSGSNTFNQSTLNANHFNLMSSQASIDTSSINAKDLHSNTIITQTHQNDTHYHTSSSISNSMSVKVGATGLSGNINFNIKPSDDIGDISLGMSRDTSSKTEAKENVNVGYKKGYIQASTDNIRDITKKSLDYKDKIISQKNTKDKFKTAFKEGGDYLGDIYKDLVPDKAKNDVTDFAKAKAKQVAKWGVQKYDKMTADSTSYIINETRDILDKAVGIKK